MRPGSISFNPSETLIYSTYYAPRGRKRLYILAEKLANRYLYPEDLLIGIIGAEGAGKSTLIRGLFPGLELTNDDDGVNVQPTPLYDFQPDDFFAPHTFHIDVRYELAFRQKAEVLEAVSVAVMHGRRVVVEHFDLISEALDFKAHILFGIGEEVLVVRPTVFGPFASMVKKVVDKTIRFRRMAHSAEDIVSHLLFSDYNYPQMMLHSDVKHGFVIKFSRLPTIDLEELEQKVRAVIEADLPIGPAGEDRIQIGEWSLPCTGTRTHARSTGEIENFQLKKQFIYDPLTKEHLMVGTVGKRESVGIEELGYMDEEH